MPNQLPHITLADRAKVLFVALLITLTGVVTLHRGDLSASTTQAVLTAEAASETASLTHEAVSHETETIENYEAESRIAYVHPERVPVLAPEEIDTETLWLARALYSETKRPEEQELVAWSIRNRVETRYRGAETYREAILDPYQFSAFNPNDRKRTYFIGLTPHSQAQGWQRTLAIAQELYEKHKLITYPRTDSRHLPADYRETVDGILGALQAVEVHATLPEQLHVLLGEVAADDRHEADGVAEVARCERQIRGAPAQYALGRLANRAKRLVYASSTLYHAFQQPQIKHVFRIIDHAAIYLLIAGTYTPVTLLSLNEPPGWTARLLLPIRESGGALQRAPVRSIAQRPLPRTPRASAMPRPGCRNRGRCSGDNRDRA